VEGHPRAKPPALLGTAPRAIGSFCFSKLPKSIVVKAASESNHVSSVFPLLQVINNVIISVAIQVTGTFAQISNTTRNLRRMKVHFEQYS
jgi:hypothetical protein